MYENWPGRTTLSGVDGGVGGDPVGSASQIARVWAAIGVVGFSLSTYVALAGGSAARDVIAKASNIAARATVRVLIASILVNPDARLWRR
jgi:hypothetical protein